MKQSCRSFGIKLWRCFIFYAAVIFASLWLLQIVFMQSFYNSMAIQNVKRAGMQIAERQGQDGLTDVIDNCASDSSLLIFLTDWKGNVLYSADEHHAVYEKKQNWNLTENGENNLYRNQKQLMNWQIGANRNLPQNYDGFLEQLKASKNGRIGYTTEDRGAYIYGMALPAFGEAGSEGAALYISMQLGAVGATTSILRSQLIWVTLASLTIGTVIAFFLSRQFSRPIFAISQQAKRMAAGEFAGSYEKGFCRELDDLSDILEETAASLERLETARRELLANVSHDLRTPLTMIKGYAEMVRYLSWNDDRKRDEDLEVIIREADRLTGLVNGILEYSAMQSPDLPVKFQDTDLSAAAQYVVDQFAPLCQQNGFKIEVSIEPGQYVKGSEILLKRVLYNLLDNAISHSGGERKIQVVLRARGDYVRVEIRDFGSGIKAEKLPYIWDRYFTAKQRNRGKNKSGLGLAISKEILLKQGADFGVESEIGRGSMFWFELKRQDRA